MTTTILDVGTRAFVSALCDNEIGFREPYDRYP